MEKRFRQNGFGRTDLGKKRFWKADLGKIGVGKSVFFLEKSSFEEPMLEQICLGKNDVGKNQFGKRIWKNRFWKNGLGKNNFENQLCKKSILDQPSIKKVNVTYQNLMLLTAGCRSPATAQTVNLTSTQSKSSPPIWRLLQHVSG